MSGEIKIVPLAPEGVNETARVLTRAFWDYSETIHLLGPLSRRRRILPLYMADDCRSACAYGSAYVAEDGKKVVGASLWLTPGAYPISWQRQVRQAIRLAPPLPWTFGILPEVSRNQKAQRAGHPLEPHYYLMVLGVDPDTQSSGIGSALITPVLEKAAIQGVGCYLTTATADNVGWYSRFGFEVTEEFNPTPTWPRVWRLWRPPSD